MFRSQVIAGILSLCGFLGWATSTMAQDPPQAKPVPSKSKKWNYAWAPEKKPLRGIILQQWPGLFEDGVVKGLKPNPWQDFLERNGIAWCDGTLDVNLLPEISAELGRPELANAPVILTGLSSTGYHSIMLANKHPDRVLAVLGAQPVAPFAKGNDDFNFNRRPLPKEGEKQDEKLIPQDVTGALDVPIFMQIGEHDSVLGSVVAYGFLEFGRRRNAPWTYFCLPKAGHGNLITPKVAIPWLESVLAQRLPRDIDLTKGAPKLKTIPADAGLLGNLQSLTVAEHSKYDGNKAKANWMPDKASAEAWKESSRAMPYELPEQKVKLPSGLITDLVVHDPNHNTVVASDNPAVKAWKIAGNLKEGDTYCTTHWYHATAVGKVPSLVRGYDWIVPDNHSVNFRGETLLEFTLSADATVYVGHDATIAKKPAWLADWKDTGEAVLIGYLGNEHRLNLYEKAFAKNAKVKLGANSEEAADPNFPKEVGLGRERVIYMTIVKPKEAKNVTAGLRVMHGGHSWATEDSAPLCQAAGITGHKKIGSRPDLNGNVLNHVMPLLEKGEIDAYIFQYSYVGPGAPNFLPTLVELGPKHNPNFRGVFMQMPWLVQDGRQGVKLPEEYEQTDLAEMQVKMEKSRKQQEAYVDEVNAKAGKRVVFLVPLGDGMLEVRKMIAAGKFPGVTRQFDSVLRGDIMPHQGHLGARLGAYMHFAALYRMSPEGLKFPGDGLTDDQRAILQKLAWEMVSKYPYAGIAKFDAPKPPKEGEKSTPKSGEGASAVSAADEKPAPLHKVISRGEAAGPYQAFPDACRLKNGDILAVFYAGYGHVSTPNAQWPKGGRICMVHSSDEGRTWSKPDILFDDELDNRDPHIAQMSDGALICSFFNAPGKLGVQIVRSLDGGKTWDQKSQSVVPEWYCSAPVREMPDGTYILGVYYENGGKAWGGVTRSTDRGKTWSDPIPIDKGSGVRLDAETDVVLLKDGSLYAALRGDAVPMHFASSRDLGRTWSPVKNIGFRAHCPHFTRLSSGEILLTHRIPNTSLHVSRDEGRSWQGPYSIDTVGGAYPSTVELKDKSVLAIYYEEGANSAIRTARFRLNPQGIEKLPLNAE